MSTFGLSQAAMDELIIRPWGRNTPLRFLLEAMQDVNCFCKPNRIDCAPCVAFKVSDNFNHRPPAKSFQRSCSGVNFTLLRGIKGIADIAPDLRREAAQVSPA